MLVELLYVFEISLDWGEHASKRRENTLLTEFLVNSLGDNEFPVLHVRGVGDAEYGTVDPECACLVGNKRYPDDLPWGYGYCVAVEVAVYLKAMSLDIGVADDYIHALAHLDIEYRP